MVGISIRNLTKSYGDAIAVDGLDLDVDDGEFVTLLGPSGCGKTTTLRCIAGLERPDSGEIVAGERALVSSETRTYVPPEQRNVGVVFQSYALWPHMNVFGNVAYPLKCRHVPRASIRQQVRDALRLVELEDYADRSVTALSGGQQQRVALARALVGEPSLMLFDEPLSNLDASLRASMRGEIQALQAKLGRTSVYVTHDQTEALTLSDRVVVMNRGRIVQAGTPMEVYSKPRESFVAKFLGYENVIDAEFCQRQGDGAIVRPVGGSASLHASDFGETSGTQRLKLAIRASSVSVSRQRRDGENTFSGTVLQAAYLGDQVEASLETTFGRLFARMPAEVAVGGGGLSEGDEIYGAISPDSIVCLVEQA